MKRKICIVPIYSKEKEKLLESFLRDNRFCFSIPKNPPKTIFDLNDKLTQELRDNKTPYAQAINSYADKEGSKLVNSVGILKL